MTTETYTGITCLQAVEAAAVQAMLKGDLPLHFRLTKMAAKLEREQDEREAWGIPR